MLGDAGDGNGDDGLLPTDAGRDSVESGGFFRRRRVGGVTRETGFIPVEAPNIDELAFLPVAAGFWKQHEMWDGTYTLDDLMDIVEMIQVSNENQRRAREQY